MVPNNGPPFRHLCLFPSERNRYNIRLRSSVDGFLAATVLVCPKRGGGVPILGVETRVCFFCRGNMVIFVVLQAEL